MQRALLLIATQKAVSCSLLSFKNLSMVTCYIKPKEHINEITNVGLKQYLCMMVDSVCWTYLAAQISTDSWISRHKKLLWHSHLIPLLETTGTQHKYPAVTAHSKLPSLCKCFDCEVAIKMLNVLHWHNDPPAATDGCSKIHPGLVHHWLSVAWTCSVSGMAHNYTSLRTVRCSQECKLLRDER